MSATDIFLSYNRNDAAAAKRFADAFAAEGLAVWWDTALRSGEAYDEVTEAALRSAKAVVVLWSPRSVVSRWVRAEATIADRCKTLVPVIIEPCERPIMFELIQTADLSHWTGEPQDKAWLALLDDVRRAVSRAVGAPAACAEERPAPDTVVSGDRGEAPSLAVLPFTNRSGLPEDEVFAFGMVEDLIVALSQGVHARVVSSSATARFRSGALPDIAAMGRELGVRYLLEGNVRRVGTDLRMTAQLVDAASGAILWTERFDRPLAELAALQEDLILEVAAHMGTQVWRQEMEHALKKPGDLNAWECVMRALAAMRQLSGETASRAIAEASRAVAIAPDYGIAHALLADLSAVAYGYLSPDNPAEVQRIRRHIDRALACDGENPAVLGHVAEALNYTGQAPEGLRRALRAIEVGPANSLGYSGAGTACVMLGRPSEALAHLANAHRIEPQSPYRHYAWSWLGAAHHQLGDLAAAELAYNQSIALNPEAAYNYCHKALALRQLGRAGEARELMREARQREPAALLELWELRYTRWNVAGPALDDLRSHLRALWAETEMDA